MDNVRFSGLKVIEDWTWDKNFKSDCALLSTDCKNVYFFDTISRGTAGNGFNFLLKLFFNYIQIKSP